MYLDSGKTTINGKTYERHLLRESYREDGKVKNRTIASLSHCTFAEIEAIRLALKHKDNLAQLISIKDVALQAGPRIGIVYALNKIAMQLGLVKVLGSDRQGKLALWQALSRLIGQGSRLHAVRLADSHGACDVLGLEPFSEDHLYANLAWLAEHQEKIERELFKLRKKTKPAELLLYDVTSTYLEGMENILAAFGYNRDKKEGKKQLVIGLLCADDGDPVAVRVFAGNTSDKSTVAEQIRTLAKSFGVEEITLVGDKGMIKSPQAQELTDAGFHYITSISKPEIRSLLKSEVLQMDFFDNELYEVEDTAHSVRYVLRRNPVRQQEMSANRQERIGRIERFVEEKNQYLAGSEKRQESVAQAFLKEKINRYNLTGIIEVTCQNRKFEIVIDETTLQEKALLDGCYVIKTDVRKDALSTEQVHDRYKDLAKVEHAFRTFKQGHLEIRPVHVRTEASTRGHVFSVMLAYKIERQLAECWKHLDCTVPEGIDELGAIHSTIVTVKDASCQKIPEPSKSARALLDAMDVRLPEVFEARHVEVVTRMKISKSRKK